VHCSTSQGASIRGDPARLGPKSEVNVASGEFPFPATGMGQAGNAIFKRLQVHDADLDPALHPDAGYFVEVQFVTRDDAAAGNLQTTFPD
jgi:hypothetical protein